MPLRSLLVASLLSVFFFVPGCGDDDPAPPDGSCSHLGQTFDEGERFPAGDGCNNCQCREGRALCTAVGCQPSDTCIYGGVTYKTGDVFGATDGCNSCSCNPEGTVGVGCTAMACPEGPPAVLTVDHCPSLGDNWIPELERAPAGDAVCAGADAPICSTDQGTPSQGCPTTCYCTCFMNLCYGNGCSAIACDETVYRAD